MNYKLGSLKLFRKSSNYPRILINEKNPKINEMDIKE
jgi:hypothetical protein